MASLSRKARRSGHTRAVGRRAGPARRRGSECPGRPIRCLLGLDCAGSSVWTERRPSKPRVGGSNPSRRTTSRRTTSRGERPSPAPEYRRPYRRCMYPLWGKRQSNPPTRKAMATCVTCGDELHPERAQKYDYCTKPECRERNARGLRVVAVGVNKAADQYVLLNERTEREMAAGRYKRRPEAEAPPRAPRRPNRVQRSEPVAAHRPSATAARRRWSEAQENLALIYRS